MIQWGSFPFLDGSLNDWQMELRDDLKIRERNDVARENAEDWNAKTVEPTGKLVTHRRAPESRRGKRWASWPAFPSRPFFAHSLRTTFLAYCLAPCLSSSPSASKYVQLDKAGLRYQTPQPFLTCPSIPSGTILPPLPIPSAKPAIRMEREEKGTFGDIWWSDFTRGAFEKKKFCFDIGYWLNLRINYCVYGVEKLRRH